MKKLGTVIFFVSFSVSVAQLLHASDPCNLNDLKKLRGGISNIQALHTHIEIYGQHLGAGVFFEYGAPGTSACQIVKLDADPNTSTQSDYQQQLQKINNLNLTNPVCDTYDGTNKGWSKFIFSDQSQVRRIDWYDQQSGFLVQSAKFDDNANIIVFDRYTDLAVNVPNPISTYNAGWSHTEKVGVRVEDQNMSANSQVAELESFSDLQINYYLSNGLAQDLANNHVALQSSNLSMIPTLVPTTEPTAIPRVLPNPSPTNAPTAVPRVVSIVEPTRVPTPVVPTLAPSHISSATKLFVKTSVNRGQQ